MGAPPERLVGGGGAPRDAHDGLERDRHSPIAEQLLELARAGEGARPLLPAAEGDGGGGIRDLGRLRERLHARGPHAELEVAEGDDVAVADRAVLYRLTVHEGPVGALEVADAQAPAVLVDLRVHLRDRFGGEHELETRAPADPERERVKGYDVDAAVGPLGLEMPGGTGAPARGWGRIVLSHAVL